MRLHPGAAITPNIAAMLTLKSLCLGSFSLLLAIIAALPVHADTVASLLGDFTVNQFCGLQLGNQQVKLHYVVVFGQLPALRELHRADANDDGVTTQAERDAYIRKLAPGLAQQLKLSADGKPLELKLKSWTSSLPKEAAGFSLRLDADYVAALPASVTASPLHLKFANQTYSGNIGWHEIRVQVAQNIAVFDTNAYSNSLTEGLSINPKVLPPGGPLDERTIHLAFVHGALPAGAKALALRPGTENGAQTVTAGAGGDSGVTTGSITGNGVMAALGLGNTWLARQTKRLVDAISGPHAPTHIMLLALLAALVLGALHAFSPGHGKTVVRAYLIGSRGTPRHAAFLGLTVTITHTLGVFLLGFATLFASRFVVPKRLFPILSLISGLLVVGIGLALLIRRLIGIGKKSHEHPHEHGHEHVHAPAPQNLVWAGGPLKAVASPLLATPAPFVAHAHHSHDHDHDGLIHSHGGTMHTHLPLGAGDDGITWSRLLALGVSGGLIPCPSAMVLLLAAVALHKTAFGLILVLIFSIGLALTLTCVGLVFLYARKLFPKANGEGLWARLLPIGSAAVITLVGLLLCYSAVISSGYKLSI